MFPVHIWLPEAHVEAPTTGSVILAGLLLKLGGYGVLRFLVPICGNVNLLVKDYIILFCFLAIIYASIAALRQVDLKKIIAYSSVVHMNFGFIGIFLNNLDGAVSFVAIMLSHGIVSSGLFFIAGTIYERLGTRSTLQLRGLCQLMPLLSVFFFLLTLSNMSFPGTLSFAAEFLIIVSIFNEFKIVSSVAIIILSGSILYNIWIVTKTIFSLIDWETVRVMKISDLSFREIKILIILIVLSVVFGTLLCNPLIAFLKLTAFLHL
jgi:NADH:ubiquinone oxidoreductase subunit 4 (subunit M)